MQQPIPPRKTQDDFVIEDLRKKNIRSHYAQLFQ